MTVFQVLAFLAGLAITCFLLFLVRSERTQSEVWTWMPWQVPALLSASFLGWSIYAVLSEGPLGFWVEHTQHAWGNQIWFDLLLAIGMALAFVVPKAKALGMNVLGWVIFVLATGCIGLTAMVARVLYLARASEDAA